VSSLKQTYKGKMTVKVITGADQNEAELKSFDIGNHGLVGLGADGTVKLKIAGHSMAQGQEVPQIKQRIEKEINSKLIN